MLSGKVFEYLAAERPILAVVPPDGAAADLIREVGTGVVAAPEDVGGDPRGAHRRCTSAGRPGSLNGAPLPEDLRERLDRRSRVREYADLLLNLGTSA